MTMDMAGAARIGNVTLILGLSHGEVKPLPVKKIIFDSRIKVLVLGSDGTLTLSPVDLVNFNPPATLNFDDLKEFHFNEAFAVSAEVKLRLPSVKDPGWGKRVEIGSGVTIGENTTLGFDHALKIGEGTAIGKNCSITINGYNGKNIGKRVKIGDDSILERVAIDDESEIGPRARVDAYSVEIGKNVKIGSDFEVCTPKYQSLSHLRIMDKVSFGDNVRVYLGNFIYVGEGAVIESNSEVREKIGDRTVLQRVVSPYTPALHAKPQWPEPMENPLLSAEFKALVQTISYLECIKEAKWALEHCTAQASKSLSADPALLIFARLSPMRRYQIVKIVGEKSSVLVFYHYSTRKFFGIDEVDPSLVAEERRIPDDMYPRLLAVPGLIENVKKAARAYDVKIAAMPYPENVLDDYGEMGFENVFMLIEFLRRQLRWTSQNPLNLLDVGSGLAKTLKIAGIHRDIFSSLHGVEKHPLRHEIALGNLPPGANIQLFQKDFFDHDLSAYDVVYAYLRFPGQSQGFMENVPSMSFHSPLASKFREKLLQLKSGAVIIMGEIRAKNWMGVSYVMHDANRQILSNMVQLEMPFPEEISGYDVFRRP